MSGNTVINEEIVELSGRYPPLEPFAHYEHGTDADSSLSDLFRGSASVNDITPTIGTEIRGVQLSTLTNAGKDQLALFTAQRKVVGKSCRHLGRTTIAC